MHSMLPREARNYYLLIKKHSAKKNQEFFPNTDMRSNIYSHIWPINITHPSYLFHSTTKNPHKLPMTWETGIQSKVESHQKTPKWYLIPPCLTLSIIKYVWRVKWSNPGKVVTPSSACRCSRYWKGSLRITLEKGRELNGLYIYIYIYIYISHTS